MCQSMNEQRKNKYKWNKLFENLRNVLLVWHVQCMPYIAYIHILEMICKWWLNAISLNWHPSCNFFFVGLLFIWFALLFEFELNQIGLILSEEKKNKTPTNQMNWKKRMIFTNNYRCLTTFAIDILSKSPIQNQKVSHWMLSTAQTSPIELNTHGDAINVVLS